MTFGEKRARAGAIAATAILSSLPAVAADFYPYNKPPVGLRSYARPPSPNWNGAYIGINAGYTTSLDNGNALCVNPGGPGCGLTLYPPAHLQPNGFIGGAQIGYNWKVAPRFVLGVETDFQGTTANTSTTKTYVDLGSGTPIQISAASRLDYLGTLRARLGLILLDPLMVYATGGLAYGGGSVSSNFAIPVTAPSQLYPANSSFNRVGWTIGGGFEYVLTRNWTVKFEGLYYDLGQVTSLGSNVIGPGSSAQLGKTFVLDGVIGRLGVNYKFDLFTPPARTPVIARY